MKKLMKSLLSLTLVGIMTLGFTGCSKSNEKDAISTIKENGKLVIGTSADYAPYEFHTKIDGKDEIVGLDISIAKEIAKNFGVELEIKDMKFEALLSSLQAGKVDMVVASMSPDEKRKKTFDFSDIYYKAIQTVLVPADKADTYKTIDDLKDLKLGAQTGSIQESLIKDLLPNANYTGLAEIPVLVSSLKGNKYDAIVMEEPVAKAYTSQQKDLGIAKDIKIDDGAGGAAIVMPKDSGELLSKVNEILKDLEDSGKIDEFVAEATELMN